MKLEDVDSLKTNIISRESFLQESKLNIDEEKSAEVESNDEDESDDEDYSLNRFKKWNTKSRSTDKRSSPLRVYTYKVNQGTFLIGTNSHSDSRCNFN